MKSVKSRSDDPRAGKASETSPASATLRYASSFLACALSIALSGCFSIDRAELMRSGEEHVLVSNYGWYLFGCVPLCAGNANPNRWSPWVFFRDDVTMDKLQARFMSYAEKTGRKEKHTLVYDNYDSVMFEIPGLNLPVPIPYVVTYKEIQLSGVLK